MICTRALSTPSPGAVAAGTQTGSAFQASRPVATSDGSDRWYVTAIDMRTGKTVWSRLTGTGVQWNNHYAAIYLGPDGVLYIATLAGLIRLADS